MKNKIKTFAINCISDEIHHPIITNLYRFVLITVVISTVILTLLKNEPTFQTYENLFTNIQIYLFGFILIDFILRIIGALQHYDMEDLDEVIHYHSLSGYLFSSFGIIDFISIIPFFLEIFYSDQKDLIMLFSLLTLLKIARFSPALLVLKDVMISERKSLLAAFYLMFILTLSLSTIIYFIERTTNPEGFGTLLKSIWWAIVTLSTVGYGDVVPLTALGKILGGFAAIAGLGMFALPAGILANGFAQEIQQQKNSTNWKMVASVELFKNLEFGVIADITRLLHLKRFRKKDRIIKKGVHGDSMYFILEGKVSVILDNGNIELSKGSFFGEIALIQNVPRTATVIASSRCELLELTRYDFTNFIQDKPEIYKQIQEIANSRMHH